MFVVTRSTLLSPVASWKLMKIMKFSRDLKTCSQGKVLHLALARIINRMHVLSRM